MDLPELFSLLPFNVCLLRGWPMNERRNLPTNTVIPFNIGPRVHIVKRKCKEPANEVYLRYKNLRYLPGRESVQKNLGPYTMYTVLSTIHVCCRQCKVMPRVPQCLSPRPNGDPHPLSRQRVCPSTGTKGGGGHTRLRVRGGGPNLDDGRKSLALCLLVL